MSDSSFPIGFDPGRRATLPNLGGAASDRPSAPQTNGSINKSSSARCVTSEGPGLSDQDVSEMIQRQPSDLSNVVDMSMFSFLKLLGNGAMSNVFLVRKRRGVLRKEKFAMKIIPKRKLCRMDEKSKQRVSTERQILQMVDHPFIVSLHWAFQTDKHLHFVLDYVNGGELFALLERMQRFDEEDALLYAAEIALALEYLHGLGIIYRDLKPENVLIDQLGHVRLTDFGVSKPDMFGSDRTSSFVGTIAYLAPEIVEGAPHSKSVDWWSLGVLLYEMIAGWTPFSPEDPSEDLHQNWVLTMSLILTQPLNFPIAVFPADDVCELIARLLVRDPAKRLCSSACGVLDMKRHAVYADLDWNALLAGEIGPSFIPTTSISRSVSSFSRASRDMQPERWLSHSHSAASEALANDCEGVDFPDFAFHRVTEEAEEEEEVNAAGEIIRRIRRAAGGEGDDGVSGSGRPSRQSSGRFCVNNGIGNSASVSTDAAPATVSPGRKDDNGTKVADDRGDGGGHGGGGSGGGGGRGVAGDGRQDMASAATSLDKQERSPGKLAISRPESEEVLAKRNHLPPSECNLTGLAVCFKNVNVGKDDAAGGARSGALQSSDSFFEEEQEPTIANSRAESLGADKVLSDTEYDDDAHVVTLVSQLVRMGIADDVAGAGCLQDVVLASSGSVAEEELQQ